MLTLLFLRRMVQQHLMRHLHRSISHLLDRLGVAHKVSNIIFTFRDSKRALPSA